MRREIALSCFGLILAAAQPAWSHPGAVHDVELKSVKSTELKEVPETKSIRGKEAQAGTYVSGAGEWRFTPVKIGDLPEVVTKNIKGAHGTIIVDKKRDVIYWGLQNVGWVALSNNFQNISVIQGAAKFSSGNLHGADILEQRDGISLIAAADDAENEIYFSDTGFQNLEVLTAPKAAPYTSPKDFKPTDVAFISPDELLVTDGYGRAYFGPVNTAPLRYEGHLFGGKKLSQTPHGITKHGKKVLVAARPEASIVIWDPKKEEAEEVLRLPQGSTVCDVDVWEDYALAPCLDGPNKTPGPIYIVNLKTKTIASVIHPKAQLGFDQAQHIHDAAWYVTGSGNNRQVYIIFTNWNPGGIGVVQWTGAASK